MPKVSKQSNAGSRRKPTQGVMARVTGLEVESTGIKLNLYGRSGTGKTTFWATFPGPILAIISSGSHRPGELRSIDTPEYRKKIKQVVLRESSEIQEIADYCSENVGEFATIVLDHASGLQDLILKEVMNLDEIPTQLSWGIASQQDWGQVAMQVKERLRSLLGLPQHVVIIAQEREFNTDAESSLLMPYVGSALTPSVVGWLNPACDYICQTFVRQRTVEKEVKVGNTKVKKRVPSGGVDYCLRTAPHDVFTTKFRLPKGTPVPEIIVDPTYEKLNKVITGR